MRGANANKDEHEHKKNEYEKRTKAVCWLWERKHILRAFRFIWVVRDRNVYGRKYYILIWPGELGSCNMYALTVSVWNAICATRHKYWRNLHVERESAISILALHLITYIVLWAQTFFVFAATSNRVISHAYFSSASLLLFYICIHICLIFFRSVREVDICMLTCIAYGLQPPCASILYSFFSFR